MGVYSNKVDDHIHKIFRLRNSMIENMLVVYPRELFTKVGR